MRHSDLKLTMTVYPIMAQLPLLKESAGLPSFPLPDLVPARRSNARGPRAVLRDGRFVSTRASANAASMSDKLAAQAENHEGRLLPGTAHNRYTRDGRSGSDGAAKGRTRALTRIL